MESVPLPRLIAIVCFIAAALIFALLAFGVMTADFFRWAAGGWLAVSVGLLARS